MEGGIYGALMWMNHSPAMIAGITSIIFLLTEVRKWRTKKYFNFKQFPYMNPVQYLELDKINRNFFLCHVVLIFAAFGFMLLVDPMIGLFGFILLNNLLDTVITSILIRNIQSVRGK